jgi:hypothetical protein
MKFIKLYEDFDFYPVTEYDIRDAFETVGFEYFGSDSYKYIDIFYKCPIHITHISMSENDENYKNSLRNPIYDGVMVSVKLEYGRYDMVEVNDMFQPPVDWMESYGFEMKLISLVSEYDAIEFFKNTPSVIGKLKDHQDSLEEGHPHRINRVDFYFKKPLKV